MGHLNATKMLDAPQLLAGWTVRIAGAFGSYYISWDDEVRDPDLPPPEISDGPYMTFRGALRAARRRIRRERRKLHEEIINKQWSEKN